MYESQYNARHNGRNSTELVVGDQILVSIHPGHKYKNNKLHPTFEGPFPVSKVKLPIAYYLRNNKTLVTHVNCVKKATLVKTSLKGHMFDEEPIVLVSPRKSRESQLLPQRKSNPSISSE